MTDLVKFLRTRLAEDEQAARETGHLVSGATFVLDDDYKHETLVMPAGRMLAEVEAKRLIITEHQPRGHYAYRDDGTQACGTCGDYTVEWPCFTLRFLALPYADHPDYREEWSPDSA